MRSPLLALPLLLALAGCDRAFVEPRLPTVEVVEPAALHDALAEPLLPLVLRASAVRAVTRVEVNGAPLRFEGGLFRDTLALLPGTNRLLVAVHDDAGLVGRDTLWALHLPVRSEAGPDLPDARGAWAGVRLPDGAALLTGGARHADSAATRAAWRLRDGTLLPTDSMRHGRAGHTLSPLPDGRVLLLGGSRTVTPASTADLVADIEVFDPERGTFASVAFEGHPVLRAYHTATRLDFPDGRAFVVLFGGWGNTALTGPDRLGTRSDVRYFEWKPGAGGDSLIARSPRVGPNLRAALAGHAQTPLPSGTPDGFGRYLVTGASTASKTPVAFALEFRPGGVSDPPLARSHTARRLHTATPFHQDDSADGLVLLAGGRAPDGAPLASVSVYSDRARRFFRIPSQRLASLRWAGVATLFEEGRILLVGGFGPDGRALTHTEMLSAP